MKFMGKPNVGRIRPRQGCYEVEVSVGKGKSRRWWRRRCLTLAEAKVAVVELQRQAGIKPFNEPAVRDIERARFVLAGIAAKIERDLLDPNLQDMELHDI